MTDKEMYEKALSIIKFAEDNNYSIYEAFDNTIADGMTLTEAETILHLADNLDSNARYFFLGDGLTEQSEITPRYDKINECLKYC